MSVLAKYLVSAPAAKDAVVSVPGVDGIVSSIGHQKIAERSPCQDIVALTAKEDIAFERRTIPSVGPKCTNNIAGRFGQEIKPPVEVRDMRIPIGLPRCRSEFAKVRPPIDTLKPRIL